MWIDPKDSYVVQVKAVEITASEKYKTGCTLKFPRLERFRPDKPWHECMRESELTKLRAKNEGYLTSGKHYELGDDEDGGNFGEDGDEPIKKRKKMTVVKKATVASNFKGIDASLVDKIGAVFQDKQVCVVVDEDHVKKSAIEKQIIELGGETVQNPGEFFF